MLRRQSKGPAVVVLSCLLLLASRTLLLYQTSRNQHCPECNLGITAVRITLPTALFLALAGVAAASTGRVGYPTARLVVSVIDRPQLLLT